MLRRYVVSGLVLTLLAELIAAQGPAPIALGDLDGKQHVPLAPSAAPATVLYFVSVSCPAVQKYLPRIVATQEDLAKQQVRSFAVYSQGIESPDEIKQHSKQAGLTFPVLVDSEQRLAQAVKAAVTPSVAILDEKGNVVYRGAIDDNRNVQLAKKHFVRDVVEDLLAKRSPRHQDVPVAGCPIVAAPKPKADATITYSSHIGALLHRHCAGCHRPGQLAPFSLLNFDQARRWSAAIDQQVSLRRMPPWKPANRNTFHGERFLSDHDLKTIRDWVQAGAPRGDAAKEPKPPTFKDDWQLGQPDLVLEAEEYEVSATGDDEYRAFVLDPKIAEDRYVQTVEFKPGNPRIVHHVMTYVAPGNFVPRQRVEDGKPGFPSKGTGPGFFPLGDLGGWGPGMQPTPLPVGMGRLLPKGSKIVMEVHYHKNGQLERDRTKIGLHFNKEPVQQKVRSQVILNMAFKLQPGSKRQEVVASWTTSEDLHAVAIIPHMHLIGKEIKVQASFPDGTEKALVHVPDWDFNWQEAYVFKQPFALPKGTKVTVTGYFDNSADNPNNPNNPPRVVGFGEATTDEMCVAYVAYVKDAEK